MKTIYSIVLLFSGVLSVSSQNYDALINRIISNNTEIAALKASVESDVMTMKSENNLPETEVGFEHQWGRKEIGNKWSFAISQGFEWPGVYVARRNATKSATEAMEFLYRSNYLDKMLEIKLLFIDIVNTQKNIHIADQVLSHMTQLKDKYHEGFKSGEISIIDVNKIDIEYISASRRYKELKTQFEVLENSLRVLNGGVDCAEILLQLNEYPQDMILSIDDYTEQIKQNDPLLNYNLLMTQSQISKMKATKMKNLPGFSLGYMHVNELGEHFNGLKVGISLPIFSNRNKVNASKSLLQSMKYEAVNTELSKLSSMFSDRANVVSLYNEMIEYKPIFEESNNLYLLKKALDGGEMSLLSYLQEVNYFLTAQQQYNDIVYEYHYSLARLNRYLLLK